MNELGKKLRELRLARNLTQREAARELGISHTRWRDFENGFTHGTNNAARPKPELLDKIADRFEYPASNLYALAGCSYLRESTFHPPSEDDLDLAEISNIIKDLSDPDRALLMDLIRCFARRTRGGNI